MAHYFADFQGVTGNWVRHDTRIYLRTQPTTPAQSSGNCIAAIIAKNPGSASPTTGTPGFQQVCEDNTLRCIKSVFDKAFVSARKPPGPDDYILVLNLFYGCDPDLDAAISRNKLSPAPVDPAESRLFAAPPLKVVWYAWGGDDRDLNPLKSRFLPPVPPPPVPGFYFEKKTKKNPAGRVVPIHHPPAVTAPAGHPQGTPHAPLVTHIAPLL